MMFIILRWKRPANPAWHYVSRAFGPFTEAEVEKWYADHDDDGQEYETVRIYK